MAVQNDLISFLSKENKERHKKRKIILSITIGVIAYRIKDKEYKVEQDLNKNLFRNFKNADMPDDVMELVDKCIELVVKLVL